MILRTACGAEHPPRSLPDTDRWETTTLLRPKQESGYMYHDGPPIPLPTTYRRRFEFRGDYSPEGYRYFDEVVS